MKTYKNRRVKGSVLFTVVSVMALLIIFLMGTLVLASSANNRAHKSYSTSQTQYTARAAVDSILAAIGDSSAEGVALVNSIQALNDVTDTPINVSVDIGDSSLGRVTSATIALCDPAYPIYDNTEQEWVYCKRYAITAEVTLGKDTTTVTSYVLRDAPVGSSGGGGGGFTTSGGVAGAGNHTSAVGGTYIALGNASTKLYKGVNSISGDPYDLTDKLYLSDSGKGTADPYVFGNKYLMEVPFVIDGSMKMNAEANFLIPQTGEGIAIWGNLNFSNFPMHISSVNMSNDDSDLTTPTVKDSYKFNEIPYLYVDGKIITESQLKIGDGNMPLNIFCGSIQMKQADAYSIKGDVYCYDAEETTVLKSNSGTLYKWASSVVNQGVTHESIGGNFISKGSLSLESQNSAKFEGDVRVEGDAKFDISNGTVTINGDLIVGETLEINAASGASLNVLGNIYAKSATGTDVKMSSTGVEKEGIKVEKKNAVLVKNIKYYNNATNTSDKQQKNYAWVREAFITDFADALKNIAEKDAEGIYDLKYSEALIPNYTDGTKLYDHYIVEKFDQKPAEGTVREYDAYIDTTTGKEITPEDRYVKGLSYNGKFIEDVNEFVKTNKIFPEYAEKEIILGIETLDGIDVGATKVLQTVKEIAETQLSPTDFDTSIPTNVLPIVETNEFDGTTVPDRIDAADPDNPVAHCTLTGTISKKTITIVPPDNGEMWIKLKNTDLDETRIIVDDTSSTRGTVNFFVEGDVVLRTGSKIMTKTYDHLFKNQNKDIWISKDVAFKDSTIKRYTYTEPGFWDNSSPVIAPVPNIYIYSSDEWNDPVTRKDPKNSINIQNGTNNVGCITAYIKAPYMLIDGDDFGAVPNKVYYDNAEVYNYLGSRRSNIGCVVCFEARLSNDWLNIYIPEKKSTTPPVIAGGGLGGHTYQAVDYTSY